MGSLWIPAALVTAFLIVIWYMSAVKSKYYKAKQELRAKVGLFSGDYFISFDGMGAVAVDKKSRKILFMEQAGARQKVVAYEDILYVELLEDSNTITRTGAAGIRRLDAETVPSLIAGVQTIGVEDAGGRQTDIVRRIGLRIVLADVDDPYRLILFWNDGGRGLLRTSSQYGRVRGEADRWCAMLQMIIKQADEDEARPRRGEWTASVLS